VEEEGECRLSPSSTGVAAVCVMKLSYAIGFIIMYAVWLKLCGHRHMTVPW